jgi:hypothetical protein
MDLNPSALGWNLNLSIIEGFNPKEIANLCGNKSDVQKY